MVFNHVLPDYEFYEVVNAFPILNNFLTKLKVSIKGLEEGISVCDFLTSSGFDSDEIDLLILKMNQEITLFLKNGTPQTYNSLKTAEDESLGIEMIN